MCQLNIRYLWRGLKVTNNLIACLDFDPISCPTFDSRLIYLFLQQMELIKIMITSTFLCEESGLFSDYWDLNPEVQRFSHAWDTDGSNSIPFSYYSKNCANLGLRGSVSFFAIQPISWRYPQSQTLLQGDAWLEQNANTFRYGDFSYRHEGKVMQGAAACLIIHHMSRYFTYL